MDIVAHGLWAGIGVSAASRYWALDRKTAIATVLAAMVPDVIQLLPFVGRVLFDADGVKVLTAYVTALPGMEPALPPAVASLTHHLHCIMHSAVVAGVVTALYWIVMRSLRLPLLGWWSHIVIDVFTHSADFYPVPVLYPFTERGFDGLAWNTPWFMVANYLVIACAIVYLRLTRRPVVER